MLVVACRWPLKGRKTSWEPQWLDWSPWCYAKAKGAHHEGTQVCSQILPTACVLLSLLWVHVVSSVFPLSSLIWCIQCLTINPLTHIVKPWVIQSFLTTDSMYRTLKCDHSLESCWAVLYCSSNLLRWLIYLINLVVDNLFLWCCLLTLWHTESNLG